MPAPLTHKTFLTPAGLNRLAAGLALAAGPALATPALADGLNATPEGFVHASDRPAAESVTPVAGESSGPQSYTTYGPEIISGPMHYSGAGTSHMGLSGGGQTTYVQGGLHSPNSPGLTAGLPLIPPLAGYDAYLPPDAGWQVPIGYPVQREVYRYKNYYPTQWYGLPGSQKQRVAPHVFMPTDTTQLGYYHQQVPTWQPPNYAVFPQAPDPRVMHHTEQAGGPSIGVRPGIYPGEPRMPSHRAQLHGLIHGPGMHGGPVTYGTTMHAPVESKPDCPADAPAAPTVRYDSPAPAPAPAPSDPGMDVDPLPSSTQPLPEAGDTPPGAPAPDDAILAPAREA